VHAALGKVAMQQNIDMRKISAWVAIAAVPTAVAGIYGMNFDHMPELHEEWGYPAALGLMFVVCVLLYRTFRHNHWL
jgi:magnesium transporter